MNNLRTLVPNQSQSIQRCQSSSSRHQLTSLSCKLHSRNCLWRIPHHLCLQAVGCCSTRTRESSCLASVSLNQDKLPPSQRWWLLFLCLTSLITCQKWRRSTSIQRWRFSNQLPTCQVRLLFCSLVTLWLLSNCFTAWCCRVAMMRHRRLPYSLASTYPLLTKLTLTRPLSWNQKRSNYSFNATIYIKLICIRKNKWRNGALWPRNRRWDRNKVKARWLLRKSFQVSRDLNFCERLTMIHIASCCLPLKISKQRTVTKARLTSCQRVITFAEYGSCSAIQKQ